MSCSHPRILKGGQVVSCGCCINCRRRRINDWAVRLELERKLNKDKSLFITLTYNDENLPKDGVLIKKDLQLFFKRLRRQLVYHNLNYKVRYFACGEYGSQYGRPHYHMILFGLPLSDWSINLVNQCWNKGFTCIKDVNFKNCKYVVKYCVKQFQKSKVSSYSFGVVQLKDVVYREFVTMSKKVGLGFGILKDKEIWNKICIDNYIKVGDFHFSIPYSFKRKARDLNLSLPLKKITILYNDLKFKDVNQFVSSKYDNIYKLLLGCQVDWSIKDFSKDFDLINFVKFSDYFKDIEETTNKEINYCKIRKIDFIEYYKGKFKLFHPFINYHFDRFGNSIFNELSDYEYWTNYLGFFKDFFYLNFDYLFY